MESLPAGRLHIGDWRVDPASGEISRNGETARLEVRTMRLLLCLAQHAGEVVSIDDLLNQVWPGVIVTQDSVYQAVASLRRQLGDDPKEPVYIATVPRLGYRMVAAVGPSIERQPSKGRRSRMGLLVAAAAALFLGIIVAILMYGRSTNKAAASALPPQRSIAVLPFLDLTDKMAHEIFADGMTEELIDKLSKIPGFRVPPPTASFYFKGKQIPVAEIARQLGVAYVLDGSVRKSGARLRVAARLVRAETGYIVWTETYDRSLSDLLKVQDDIASEVTKALKASIVSPPGA